MGGPFESDSRYTANTPSFMRELLGNIKSGCLKHGKREPKISEPQSWRRSSKGKTQIFVSNCLAKVLFGRPGQRGEHRGPTVAVDEWGNMAEVATPVVESGSGMCKAGVARNSVSRAIFLWTLDRPSWSARARRRFTSVTRRRESATWQRPSLKTAAVCVKLGLRVTTVLSRRIFSARDVRHYGWPAMTASGALCEAKTRVSAAEQSHVRRVHRTEPHGCTD